MMTNGRDELAELIRQCTLAEGINPSPVPGVNCIRYSTTSCRNRSHWRASFGIVAQGCKEVFLGREVYKLDSTHYTATPIQLPVISRVSEATREKPFLALLIDIDPRILGEVASQLDDVEVREPAAPVRAIYSGKASEKMVGAATRLAQLFQSPEEARILGPLVVKEILYNLLKGPEGLAIRQFVRSESKMQRISQAIYRINSELSGAIDVPTLARDANMSRSSFFKHFKDVTAMSPIQYQKRLRLLEARRLMVDEGETAERSAFKVGYESASQFSREYSRMFGNSPFRDTHAAIR